MDAPTRQETPCPTCDEEFNGQMGMRVHHSKVHGESISRSSECERCGSSFTPDYRDQRFCGDDCRGAWLSDTNTGSDHPQWGGREVVVCEWCEEDFEVYPSEAEGRRFCSEGCYHNWHAEERRGERHHNWKPPEECADRSKIYKTSEWRPARKEALERDGHTCQDCGVEEGSIDTTLHVHHLEPVRVFDNPADAHVLDNLVTLCPACHWRRER